jgi:hypothetical protein
MSNPDSDNSSTAVAGLGVFGFALSAFSTFAHSVTGPVGKGGAAIGHSVGLAMEAMGIAGHEASSASSSGRGVSVGIGEIVGALVAPIAIGALR